MWIEQQVDALSRIFKSHPSVHFVVGIVVLLLLLKLFFWALK